MKVNIFDRRFPVCYSVFILLPRSPRSRLTATHVGVYLKIRHIRPNKSECPIASQTLYSDEIFREGRFKFVRRDPEFYI